MLQKVIMLFSKPAITLILLLFVNKAMAFGALAIDSNQGSQHGFSYDYATEYEAEQRALSECGSGCQIVLTFPNGCGAYAADQTMGSTAYGWGTSNSENGAKNRALSECSAHGGTDCIIRVFSCNSR